MKGDIIIIGDHLKKIIHRASSRGFRDYGFLKSYHTFNFADYYHPEREHFGLLKVFNDDFLTPNKGFDLHDHNNMEIVSIPLSGALNHQDTQGNKHIINYGSIQRMSAGSGISHSEYNNSKSEEANFLQIWILPKQQDIKPSYGFKKFDESKRKNKLQTVIAPHEIDGAIWINQDAYFSLSHLTLGFEINYKKFNKKNGVYIFVIEGAIKVDGEILNKRDALGIVQGSSLSLLAIKNSEILIIEVPMI